MGIEVYEAVYRSENKTRTIQLEAIRQCK